MLAKVEINLNFQNKSESKKLLFVYN